MNRFRKALFVSLLVSIFALSGCTNNTSDIELLNTTVENQATLVNEIWDHTQEKVSLLSSEELSDSELAQVQDATYEIETRRIRIDTQVAALADGHVVDGRERVSFEKQLEDHQELIEEIEMIWNDIAADMTLISDASAIDEDVTAAYENIESQIENLGDALTNLHEALTN